MILALIIAQFSSCQTIVPRGTIHVPSGAYVKDINNSFTPYIGTWEGTVNNKKYTFKFTKFEKYLKTNSDGYAFYKDYMLGNFKVTDLSTGLILYDNLSATEYENFRMSGNPIPTRGICFFSFLDTEANCSNGLEFMLRKIKGQPNQLTYCDFQVDDFWKFWDCPAYPDRTNIPIFLPRQDFILTKI